MDKLIYYICVPLGYLMKGCWELLGNYGLSIILFTLATKIILMPLSVWLQYNSIKIVRIQPEINFMKAKFFGDRDRITDEQAALFKREKYNPLASLIPLVIQLVLLMGVVEIIYNPLTYILRLPSEEIARLAAALGAENAGSSYQLEIIRSICGGNGAALGLGEAILADIGRLGEKFCFFDLSLIPSKTLGLSILVPLIAGGSAYWLCIEQNRLNPLQAEQGKANKYGMTVFSVALSLYLGFFVPAGIALYWVASNVFAIVVQIVMNLVVNPKKHIDYDALEKSRAALAELEALDGGAKKKTPQDRENARRERADYKRFFSVVNKHIVFYSEKSGFYKYYEALISQILALSNAVVHYVTNDPDDVIFTLAKSEPRIKPYYIGVKKLIPLFMRLEADVVVMTTPDLDKFYIKRSLVSREVEYIYSPHETMSTIMGLREGALDAFDTIFCAGPHIEREVRATEAAYGLPAKNLVRFGYPLIEKLIASAEAEAASAPKRERKEILIAPSWQEDNLLDSCLPQLLEQLVRPGYHVTVRPHPEYAKRYPEKLAAIVERFASITGEGLTFELDFTVNKSIYSSDLLITDWSGISVEFCFSTKKPAIFINTKLKAPNPNWQKTGLVPVEISLRNEIGVALEKSQLDGVGKVAERLIAESDGYREKISEVLAGFLYNIGDGGKEGAKYILSRVAHKKK